MASGHKQTLFPGKRIAVLISGSGTNLQALIDAGLPVVHVLSNRKAAYGLERARLAGIPTDVFSIVAHQKEHLGATRVEYDAALAQRVLASKPDLVVLAGFMHILSEEFLRPFEANGLRILNLHPALPGAFDGANAIQRAWQAFQDGQIDKTGVMVHEVVKEVDRGQPVLVKEVDIKKGESLEDLTERLHAVEHVILVDAVKKALGELQ